MTIDLVSIGAWAAFDRIVDLDGDLERGATVSVRSHPPHQEVFYGDCSINVAAVASALGARAAVATVVGEDFDSCGYREHLETLGVDTSGVIVHPGATSGWNLNISTPDGSSYCISHRDASRFQDTYPPPAELITQARWLVVSEAFGPYTLAAAQLAHQAGVSVALNGMVASAGDLASELLRVADLLMINQAESDTLERLLGAGSVPARRVVTKGSQGALVIDGDNTHSVDPVTGGSVIDPTGAGDAFTAATVVGLVRGHSLRDAAALASAAASFVIEKVGCQTNLPSWQDVQQRLRGEQ